MRAFLLGLAVLAAVPACGKGGDANGPAVVAGAPVGTVVELTGKVTATRAGKTRDLAIGAEVSGDDQIQTGPDATVTILLAHNGVRWNLVANRTHVVAESVAWNLPKIRAGSSTTAGEDMSAAGRHAERAAAETAESTAAAAPKADPAPPPAAVAAAPPAVQPTTPPMPAMTVAKPPPAPPPPSPGAGGLGMRGTGEGGGGQGEGIGLGSIGTIGKGGGAPGGNGDPALAAKIRTGIRDSAAIRRCIPAGERAALSVKCTQGSCHLLHDVATLDAKANACVIAQLKSMKFDVGTVSLAVFVVALD